MKPPSSTLSNKSVRSRSIFPHLESLITNHKAARWDVSINNETPLLLAFSCRAARVLDCLTTYLTGDCESRGAFSPVISAARTLAYIKSTLAHQWGLQPGCALNLMKRDNSLITSSLEKKSGGSTHMGNIFFPRLLINFHLWLVCW